MQREKSRGTKDTSVVSVRQFRGGVEATIVDNGSKVVFKGDFGEGLELCYSSIRLMDRSILVACNERSHYLVFQLTSTGELEWKNRVVCQDKVAARNSDAPAVAVGFSGARSKPAECEITLDEDRKTAIFFAARRGESIIAELELGNGLIIDSASLKQVADEKNFNNPDTPRRMKNKDKH